jgi:hypothetical protein
MHHRVLLLGQWRAAGPLAVAGHPHASLAGVAQQRILLKAALAPALDGTAVHFVTHQQPLRPWLVQIQKSYDERIEGNLVVDAGDKGLSAVAPGKGRPLCQIADHFRRRCHGSCPGLEEEVDSCRMGRLLPLEQSCRE